MPTAATETVGFIGLGHMGDGMVRRLISVANRNIVVWNRSPGKAQALAAESKGVVTVAASPADVVRQCAVVYVILSEPNAVKAVYEMKDGILAGVSSGKSIVDCATLAVEDMTRLEKQVTGKGGRFLEAPVSGSKAPAAQGQLIFLAAGNEALYKERKADFEAMGKAMFFFGAVGGGTRIKLAVNMVMGTMLASLGEGLSLTKEAGIEAKLLLEVLDLGAMACPLFKLKGPKMLASDYAPAFPLKHAEKDVKLAVALGQSLGLGLPIAAKAGTAMRAAMAQGLGDDDFSAVYEVQQKIPVAAGVALSPGSLALICAGSALVGFLLARRQA